MREQWTCVSPPPWCKNWFLFLKGQGSFYDNRNSAQLSIVLVVREERPLGIGKMKGHGELQGHERLLSHVTMVDCCFFFFSLIFLASLSQVMEQIPTV